MTVEPHTAPQKSETINAENSTEKYISIKQQIPSKNYQELNVDSAEEKPACSTDLIADLIAEEEACDFLQKRKAILADFESAPPSIVNPLVEIDNIIEPRSAPLPINQEISPLSLTNIGNNRDGNVLVYGNQFENSSPVRGINISGIELLSVTEEEYSGSSWIADTDESKYFGRKRQFRYIQSENSSSDFDDMLPSKKENVEKPRKKRYTKKKLSCKKIHTEENETQKKNNETENVLMDAGVSAGVIVDETDSECNYNDIIEEQTESVLMNAGVSVPYNPSDETDCESYTNDVIEEQQLENTCDTGHNIKRWKKSVPAKWKREVEKRNKSNGLPYKAKNGKIQEAKLPRNTGCNVSCRNKCNENFTNDERQKMCKEYWELSKYKQQKEYLLRRIIIKPVRRVLKNLPIEKQRATSREYVFIKNNEHIQVCKSFFMATLSISSSHQIPSTADSLMYYSRKLNLYNLSVYEFKPPQNNAHCLIWTEVNGKRGSIEIASALNTWFKTIPKEVSNVTLYSDTCSGQNRNQYMSAYLLHLVQTNPNLSVVEQKYLESGHSFMEVDSMHSAIEKEKRYTEVFSVIDWKGIMNSARSTRHKKTVSPYKVHELTYKDMLDIKELANKIIKNRNICTTGKKVNWLKIKCLRYEKESPNIIKFRYDYDGAYMSLDTSCSSGRMTRRATNIENIIDISLQKLTMAYKNPLPITEAKKSDLMNLCKKGIIPIELHGWYENLLSAKTTNNDLQSENDSE